MGASCFEPNVTPGFAMPPDRLRTLIDLSKNKCKEERDKKIETINKHKSEIIKYIKENDMKSANTKTDYLIKDENYVEVYDILDPIFELIKTKCNYIVSTSECPEDFRDYLDSLLYATIRLDIDELMTFKGKITKIYGSHYVENAINNKNKKVNNDLVEKLKITTYSDEVIKERKNQLKSENQSKHQRINSPTRSILKKLNNNNINNNQVNPGKNILEIEKEMKKEANKTKEEYKKDLKRFSDGKIKKLKGK